VQTSQPSLNVANDIPAPQHCALRSGLGAKVYTWYRSRHAALVLLPSPFMCSQCQVTEVWELPQSYTLPSQFMLNRCESVVINLRKLL
jgi:hypothetical protein